MIVLASASPRRQELISLITDSFVVEPADIDETVTQNIETEQIPEYLALRKAQYIFDNGHTADVVIGSDTGVFIDGEMLGKPKDEADAIAMLKRLSGRKHRVITGCAVISKEKTESFSQVTEVEFYPLTDEEITAYVHTGEPMDKAGAYGIQQKGALIVKGIDGDYFNVVGLPVSRLYRVVQKYL